MDLIAGAALEGPAMAGRHSAPSARHLAHRPPVSIPWPRNGPGRKKAAVFGVSPVNRLSDARRLRWSGQLPMLVHLNTGWGTPGLHGPEETGADRRQRNVGFTLKMAFRA